MFTFSNSLHLAVGFRSKLSSSELRDPDVVENELSIRNFKQFRRGFLKGNIVIVMGDLDAKVALTTPFWGKPVLVDHNENGGRFLDFCSLHRFVVSATLFQHRVCHKIR